MSFYLVGTTGRLGQAIALEYGNANIKSLPRSVYQDWSLPNQSDLVSSFFDRNIGSPVTIFVASGLLDPNLSYENLLQVNYHLPKNIIDGATKTGSKIITFGTVMEKLVNSKNSYIQTKVKLAEYVTQAVNNNLSVLHLQLHTLFGLGQPSPFMFLGQMLASIKANKSFKMTSGRQLREYHHLMDEARAIKKIVQFAKPGVLNISHGKPLSLKIIAENVFNSLGKTELLHICALPEPDVENYQNILQSIEYVQPNDFRDSLPSIIKYMQDCYSCEVPMT